MLVTDLRPVPLLVRTDDFGIAGPDDVVLDDFADDLAVAYADRPVRGARLLSWGDLERLAWSHETLQQAAIDMLECRLDTMQMCGQPPVLMLSFGGLESSLLLLDEVWDELERVVPGEIVVGVPARDVVMVTATYSPPGLERVRRAVDRMFCAGQRHPLTRRLLVRRDDIWQPLRAGRAALDVD